MRCSPSLAAVLPPACTSVPATPRPWLWTALVVGSLHAAALVTFLPAAQTLKDEVRDAGLLLVTVVAADPAARPAVPATVDAMQPDSAADRVPVTVPAAVPAPHPVAEGAGPAVVTDPAPVAADESPGALPVVAEAPAPGRPAVADAAPAGGGQAASATYFGQLKGWLNRHKRYPTAAKKAKEQGVVVVNFTIDRRGELIASAIEKSSGHPLLDAAALALLQRAEPMPRIPESLGLQTLTVSLPIDYSLITH